ncbi:hypothetical protein RFI_04952 [Reticulomyxa filosa]|uniref:Vacuole membrane protein 1 n=1 Tax=Reticulomyxa filosa TaxID=46433 RepID=X6P201_RETFI|nr:hypothetical protein RFI_04952 [Reticulomyxa filosa]|eukprot:ETO32163.1 hypothetical protein RFI_04952 [Reticulomyxa filosa]
MICRTRHEEKDSTVTYMGLLGKVIWPCFLWGSGTAIGEIPPYAVSLAASRAGKYNEQQWAETSANHWIDHMKKQMIHFLSKYGFWAVLAFAAYPNMAFDIIACGHFQMPFWKFFGATFIGKALIKVNLQAMFFIVVFHQHTLNWVIHQIHRCRLPSFARQVQLFVEMQRKALIETDQSNLQKQTSFLKIIWTIVIWIFMLVFIGSVIQAFAQQKQKEIDDKINEEWLNTSQHQNPEYQTIIVDNEKDK